MHHKLARLCFLAIAITLFWYRYYYIGKLNKCYSTAVILGIVDMGYMKILVCAITKNVA